MFDSGVSTAEFEADGRVDLDGVARRMLHKRRSGPSFFHDIQAHFVGPPKNATVITVRKAKIVNCPNYGGVGVLR